SDGLLGRPELGRNAELLRRRPRRSEDRCGAPVHAVRAESAAASGLGADTFGVEVSLRASHNCRSTNTRNHERKARHEGTKARRGLRNRSFLRVFVPSWPAFVV